MAILSPVSVSRDPLSSSSALTPLRASAQILSSKLKFREIEPTHLRLSTSFNDLFIGKVLHIKTMTGMQLRKSPVSKLKASRDSVGLTKELQTEKLETTVEVENECGLFDEMKHRFLSFKKHKFFDNLEHYQNLANDQAPKFMVIACADSRVCPSTILGFQPGEAFIIRNVANLVPPCESGPSETNAALEFAVNSIKVENILVIGHSRCGGIRALMGMQDEEDPSFIRSWVLVGKNAKLNTKAAAQNLSFDHQCKHCEKESVNCSLLNLLTYPWIEEKVREGALSLHGGYYDFINCTFEKWTLEYNVSNSKESSEVAFRNHSLWS